MARKKEMDNLSKDAAAALAAGMSYGKWKAMQRPVTFEKAIPDGWQVCPQCGKAFKPKIKNNQIYCEIGCQRAAEVERRRKKREAGN